MWERVSRFPLPHIWITMKKKKIIKVSIGNKVVTGKKEKDGIISLDNKNEYTLLLKIKNILTDFGNQI